MKLEQLSLETLTPSQRVECLQTHSLPQRQKNRLPTFYKHHKLIPTLQELHFLCDACKSIYALQTLQDYIVDYYDATQLDYCVEDLHHKIDHKILDIQAPSVYKTIL